MYAGATLSFYFNSIAAPLLGQQSVKMEKEEIEVRYF